MRHILRVVSTSVALPFEHLTCNLVEPSDALCQNGMSIDALEEEIAGPKPVQGKVRGEDVVEIVR